MEEGKITERMSFAIGKVSLVSILVVLLLSCVFACCKKEVPQGPPSTISETFESVENSPSETIDNSYTSEPIDGSYYDVLDAWEHRPNEVVEDVDVIGSAVDVIKFLEGFSPTGYRCPGNKLSIGYGFDQKVFKRSNIGKKEAVRYLRKLVKQTNDHINFKVRVDLSPGQRIALISFVYNIGFTRFDKSTILKHINNGDFKLASKEFKRWVYCTKNGHKKKLRGLVGRRYSERLLFVCPTNLIKLQLDELT